jgi:hypothetical protein
MKSAKNLILAIVVQGPIYCPLQLLAQEPVSEVRVEATQEGATESSESQPLSEQIEAMEAAQEEILETLEISAPMELELEGGVDPVMEAMEKGFIIETTLEEVVAAIAAAEATPDPEDDIAAFKLKCRGSYRFFLDPAPPAPETVQQDAQGETDQTISNQQVSPENPMPGE